MILPDRQHHNRCQYFRRKPCHRYRLHPDMNREFPYLYLPVCCQNDHKTQFRRRCNRNLPVPCIGYNGKFPDVLILPYYKVRVFQLFDVLCVFWRNREFPNSQKRHLPCAHLVKDRFPALLIGMTSGCLENQVSEYGFFLQYPRKMDLPQKLAFHSCSKQDDKEYLFQYVENGYYLSQQHHALSTAIRNHRAGIDKHNPLGFQGGIL